VARVIVVGGGLAGCASAARLAKLGHEVALVERLPTLGGAIGVLQRDGFSWDTGPGATALPAVLRDLFRKSGRPLERELDLLPVQPLREHRFADGSRLALPSGSRAAQLHATEEALGGGLGRLWVDHVHGFARPWDLIRRDFLERPWSPGVAASDAERLLRDRTPLARVVRRLPDGRLRAMAVHHAVAAGQDPRRIPAWTGVLDYVEQNFGTWTFRSGLGTLAGLLEKRLRERRVTVLTSTTAVDLVTGRDGVTAVVTSAGTLPADRVVVAVDPRRLPVLARFVRRTRPAPPPTVAHLGLAEDLELPAEVVLHGEPHLVLRGEPVGEGSGRAYTLLCRGRLREDPVATLAARGVEVRHLVRVRVDRSPEDIVARYAGSPYGVRWRGPRTIRDRMGSVTPVPGVHAAGAATGGGGWVPFVGLTAAVVADEIGPA